MTSLRPAAIAGSFYPAGGQELQSSIDNFLATKLAHQENSPPPKAIIAPHAGLRFSGQCAAYGYQLWAPLAQSIRRVILFGPAHRVGLLGLGASSADYWQTP
ncbi:MAG: AmmeMemoRadiSam system protein B, partial [Pseudomonadota bacterium]